MNETVDEIMKQVDIMTDNLVYGSGVSYLEEIAKLRIMVEDAVKVPDDWQLVPLEPTDEMIGVMADRFDAYRVDCVNAWEAVLAEAPEYEANP